MGNYNYTLNPELFNEAQKALIGGEAHACIGELLLACVNAVDTANKYSVAEEEFKALSDRCFELITDRTGWFVTKGNISKVLTELTQKSLCDTCKHLIQKIEDWCEQQKKRHTITAETFNLFCQKCYNISDTGKAELDYMIRNKNLLLIGLLPNAISNTLGADRVDDVMTHLLESDFIVSAVYEYADKHIKNITDNELALLCNMIYTTCEPEIASAAFELSRELELY